MNAILHTGGLLPSRALTGSPNRRDITLRWPGFDPARDCLDFIIMDHSGSLNVQGGNDPVGSRYTEAQYAVRALAKWTLTGRQQLAVLSFDHPRSKIIGPLPLHRAAGRKILLNALKAPANPWGASNLVPAMQATNRLAQSAEDADLRCTIFSDFELTDLNPDQPYEELTRFPGQVHAVVLNAEPPVRLEELPNVTVTRIASDSPTGLTAAALLHSLAATRRRSNAHRSQARKRAGKAPPRAPRR